VYGAVALIVKADDAGMALAASSTAAVRMLGRGIVGVMPRLLAALAVVGTAAMIWVGGGILVHGLEVYGLGWPEHTIHDLAEAAGAAVPFASGVVAWLAGATGSGVVGLLAGALLIPVVGRVVVPIVARIRRAEARSAD
jgi:predicted DNA repair protein MutK